MASPSLSGIGVWSAELAFHDPDATADAAAELEALGYSAVWIPDGFDRAFAALDRLVDVTATITVASGILSVWQHDAAEVLAWWYAQSDERRRRLLLGLGVSHRPLVGEQWGRPLTVMTDYLDALDERGLPADRRCLAALGPKMLELARDRSAGAHPYLVAPEHTERARQVVGDGLLAVEQGVVLESDPARARSIARPNIDGYCGLPNYVRNWKRLGFTDEDVDTRSDQLVDALIAWGGRDAIFDRIDAHRAAGADHVCIQVLNEPGAPMNRAAWRELAPARG
jgi:probable F420-dependent oxidoreductase